MPEAAGHVDDRPPEEAAADVRLRSSRGARGGGPEAGEQGAARGVDPAEIVAWFVASGRLCRHQLAAAWTYFGPEVREEGRGGRMTRRVTVVGARVPPCAPCGLAGDAYDSREGRLL